MNGDISDISGMSLKGKRIISDETGGVVAEFADKDIARKFYDAMVILSDLRDCAPDPVDPVKIAHHGRKADGAPLHVRLILTTLGEANKALRHLSNHPRPVGGQERYNAEHLIQIADDLESAADFCQACPPNIGAKPRGRETDTRG